MIGDDGRIVMVMMDDDDGKEEERRQQRASSSSHHSLLHLFIHFISFHFLLSQSLYVEARAMVIFTESILLLLNVDQTFMHS